MSVICDYCGQGGHDWRTHPEARADVAAWEREKRGLEDPFGGSEPARRQISEAGAASPRALLLLAFVALLFVADTQLDAIELCSHELGDCS